MMIGSVLISMALVLPQPPLQLRALSPRCGRVSLLEDGDEEPASQELCYAIGLTVAKQLSEVRSLLMPHELRSVGTGIADGLVDEQHPSFNWNMYGKEVATLLAQRQLKLKTAARDEGVQWLVDAAVEPGAVATASGLVYRELVSGHGQTPTATHRVTAHYTGTLIDGTVFDSSVTRGEPLVFQLKDVIKGWQQGMQLMKVGGKALLTIPAELAYGDKGTGAIPPGATLRFEVELLAVE